MIKNFLSDDDEPAQTEVRSEPPRQTSGDGGLLNLFDDQPATREKEDFVVSDSKPESIADTVRQSGLAWSAGIAFFAAVVFMMVLGWGADVLLGTSPWGIVGGIILGSIIGFVQFFRLTSQIFKK